MGMSTEERLQVSFPNLASSCYEITSPFDPMYNCIAWAAGDTERWWEPDPFGICYWPEGVLRKYTLSSYNEAFRAIGFSPSTDEVSEPGFTMIALFSNKYHPTHASRQLDHGKWTSKIGKDVDISHDLHALCGDLYGDVTLFMKGPKVLSLK